MKIYLFCHYRDYFSEMQMKQLKNAATVIVVRKIQPIGKCQTLMNDKDEKIIAMDPDSCAWKISNEEIGRIPNLKAIVFNTTSYDFIDLDYCRQKNIVVTNNRNFASEAVVEWLLMMSLMVARKLPLVHQNGWKIDYSRHMGMELYGKTAGIIGLGNIGTRLGELLQALGMNVVYWSKKSRNDRLKRVSLTQLFKTADYIYPCLAKNQKTMRLIDKKHIRSMKKSACLIAASPQYTLMDCQTIAKQVNDKKIYGIGFEYERGGELLGNIKKGNALITPALAWYTKETTMRNAEKWVENMVNATRSMYPNKVN